MLLWKVVHVGVSPIRQAAVDRASFSVSARSNWTLRLSHTEKITGRVIRSLPGHGRAKGGKLKVARCAVAVWQIFMRDTGKGMNVVMYGPVPKPNLIDGKGMGGEQTTSYNNPDCT